MRSLNRKQEIPAYWSMDIKGVEMRKVKICKHKICYKIIYHQGFFSCTDTGRS